MPCPRFFAAVGFGIVFVGFFGALLEASAYFWWSSRSNRELESAVTAIAASPAYQGYPWAQTFWKEERDRWLHWHGDDYVPFRVWGNIKWSAEYVNVDQSEMGIWRRTINAAGTGCGSTLVASIWVFGGSTVFGTAVPDAETLPSHLSQQLNKGLAGCIQVTNLGVEGYVTNQELLLLVELLKLGNRPQAVVFYDGLDDAYVGSFSPGIAIAHMDFDRMEKLYKEGRWEDQFHFWPNWYSVRMLRSLAPRWQSAPERTSVAGTAVSAQATLENYVTNLKIVRALGQMYGFKAYFFWQPSLFYGQKPTVPFEEGLIESQRKAADGKLWRALQANYEEAKRRAEASGDFVFLGDIFERVNEPIYLDVWMHLGPLGNKLVAKAIADRIQGDFSSGKR